MEIKLVINDSARQVQRLIKIDASGSHPENEVIWDERKDGILDPAVETSIGGLIRVGNQLQVDQAKLNAYNAAKLAAEQTEQARRDALAQVRQTIKDANVDGTLTNAEVVALIKALVKYVRSTERA